MELEPLYQQAFRLLHSRREDATEKLKKKLFEVMGRRYEPPKEVYKLDKFTEYSTLSTSAAEPTATRNWESRDEKHTFQMIKLESDVDSENRLHFNGAEAIVVDDAGNSEKAAAIETETADIDADDFAVDMGIACIVCRQFDVSSNNQLVECQECHSLYHQLCHKPSVTEQEVNDPRSVWYCVRCSKTMKKLEKNSSKPTKASGSQQSSTKESAKESNSSHKHDSAAVKQENSFFRRLDTGKQQTSKDSGKSSSKPYSGLAGLAANLSGKPVDKAHVQKDDKTVKDRKKPSTDGAHDKGSKIKVASSSATHEKDKKPKLGTEKSAKHRLNADASDIKERKESNDSVLFSVDDSTVRTAKAVGSLSGAKSQSTEWSRSTLERTGNGSIDERKSDKAGKGSSKGEETAARAEQSDKPPSRTDRLDKDLPSSSDWKQSQHKVKQADESLHKHKVKKLKKD